MTAEMARDARQSAISLRVLYFGIVTSGLTLLAIWWLIQQSDEFNVMGLYANGVIPVGALLAGVIAGSGCGFAAWWLGRRVSTPMILCVVGLQILAYFAAQYLEFRHLVSGMEGGEDASFWAYFDWATRAFAFEKRSGEAGEPMGGWGYAFRALEIAGFTLGGIIVPLGLRFGKAYCERCGVYMKTEDLGLLPAGLVPKKTKKMNAEELAEREKEEQAALENAQAMVEQLCEHASAGEEGRIREIMAEYRPRKREYYKLGCRIQMKLDRCPKCHNGMLRAIALRGRGDKVQSVEVAKAPLVAAGSRVEGETAG